MYTGVYLLKNKDKEPENDH